MQWHQVMEHSSRVHCRNTRMCVLYLLLLFVCYCWDCCMRVCVPPRTPESRGATCQYLMSDLIPICIASVEMSSSKVLISHLFMRPLLMLKQHYVTVTALKSHFRDHFDGTLTCNWENIDSDIFTVHIKRLFLHHATWVEQSSSSHTWAFNGAPWHTIKLVKLDHILQHICFWFFFLWFFRPWSLFDVPLGSIIGTLFWMLFQKQRSRAWNHFNPL